MVTFSPLNHCLWGLRHVFGLFAKFMRFNWAIYVSLHSTRLSLLIISCFNLSTPSFFLLLTNYAKPLLSAASKFLAYRQLSWTVFPTLLWWIVQLYTEKREKYLRIVITTGKHLNLLLMFPKWAFSLVFRLFLHWLEVSSARARKTTLA